MHSYIKAQDLLLQNQSMRLVEMTLDKTAENIDAVRLEKARYLQAALPTPIVGTAGVVLMYYFLIDQKQEHASMLVWLLLGMLATCWRGAMFFKYRHIFVRQPSNDSLRSYLVQTTLTAIIAGMAFGSGWLTFYEHLPPELQIGFLFTNIVMLFGGLYAYSPHLPAYISFSLFSLGPAMWQVRHSAQEWLAQIVGIALVVLVSQMFSFRWSQNFRHNVLLQQKNAKLFRELNEKKEHAERATRAKSRFLASVSHDLRQPLHAINLYLAVLKQVLPKIDTTIASNENLAQSSLQNLQDSATQLTRMFEALIDISKLDAGTSQPNIAPISIGPIIEQLSNDYAEIAKQSNLAFETKLPSEIESIQVLADPIMLERVLRNLLSNAINHTQSGGVRLSMKSKRGKDAQRLEFRVVDTGPGISAAERAKVFEEFYQVRKNAVTGHGVVRNLGLGLAISSRLAELLNTRIRLHSYLGLGSVFAFDLDMKYRTQNPKAKEISSTPSHDYGHLNRLCVATVDDDRRILDSTAKLLHSYGVAVISASNSSELWELLQKTDRVPDVFLVDYRLVNESGLDLIESIQQKFGTDTPCILITGDTAADQVESFHSSVKTVLYKPITDQKLLDSIYEASNCGASFLAIQRGTHV